MRPTRITAFVLAAGLATIGLVGAGFAAPAMLGLTGSGDAAVHADGHTTENNEPNLDLSTQGSGSVLADVQAHVDQVTATADAHVGDLTGTATATVSETEETVDASGDASHAMDTSIDGTHVSGTTAATGGANVDDSVSGSGYADGSFDADAESGEASASSSGSGRVDVTELQ